MVQMQLEPVNSPSPIPVLKDDCYRSGISATPVCICSADRETSQHFLLHCNIHKKTRIELFEQLHEITASKEIYRSAIWVKNKTDLSKIFYWIYIEHQTSTVIRTVLFSPAVIYIMWTAHLFHFWLYQSFNYDSTHYNCDLFKSYTSTFQQGSAWKPHITAHYRTLTEIQI